MNCSNACTLLGPSSLLFEYVIRCKSSRKASSAVIDNSRSENYLSVVLLFDRHSSFRGSSIILRILASDSSYSEFIIVFVRAYISSLTRFWTMIFGFGSACLL